MTTKSGSGPSIARLCAAAIFSRLSFARRLALALPMAPDDSGGEGFEVVGCCPCSPEYVEGVSVLKNSSMVLWSPDQGLKYPFPAVFWPWFGSVGFIFDLPTGQIATFSTGWGVHRSRPRRFRKACRLSPTPSP